MGCSCSVGKEPLDIFLSASKGLCRACREERPHDPRLVDVRYVADEVGVYLERLCPDHGPARAKVAETLEWFLTRLQAPTLSRPPEKVIERGDRSCPDACGPCEFHGQRCNLPVFSITNACDLRCPICFTYNREDELYFMSAEELSAQLDFVVEATGGVDLVNITGGEPTMHPQLCELLALARRPEIGRVTVNSNGLRLARDPHLAAELADLGAYVVLSLDTLDGATSERIHGRDIVQEKLAALENLRAAGVPTTLLMVLIGGVNEGELSTLWDLMRKEPMVRSLTIQTMTYTGQGGGTFGPRKAITVEGVEERLLGATKGSLGPTSFVPLPTAHPLCYSVCYLLLDDEGKAHGFDRLLNGDALAAHLADGYLLQPGQELEAELRQAIDTLWAEGDAPELLTAIKELLRALYPAGESLSLHERQRRAEARIKTIYVHAHMDEDTYEVGRAMRCPDQVPVDAERLIGACNYNLFFRAKDPRFWVEPAARGVSGAPPVSRPEGGRGEPT